MTKHTKGEWRIGETTKQGIEIDGEKCGGLAVVNHCLRLEESQANAEFIVRACNSHAELLEALKDILNAYDSNMGASAVRLRMELGRDAIRKAEAK